ncbi:type II toxin-antitoxin system RelE/ParE family toxin [Methylomonas sp. UP202]|uniref:type II toxin-antitoxin system RelE/ParE family toxin n=1 Tax=Methylomonas sp. UP202 TaxID=3040943 RepID=UPI00247AA475|nr:type II toxin-antitoxin system RelE/ParE family toxin [Methylomonas sp. UP202]WGS85390.1 type II toxin-antitoxin system RelE/ParE family toxin [Methylomonas sp. UP202]
MKLRWSDRSTDDLAEIYWYIARNNPQNAKHGWINSESVPEMPLTRHLIGRIVPELGQADIREVFVEHYRIVYRVEDDGISVLTVFEGHRVLKL